MKIKMSLIIIVFMGLMFSNSMSMQNKGPQEKSMQRIELRKAVTENDHGTFHAEYETYKDMACCCCLTIAVSFGLGACNLLEAFIVHYKDKNS